MLVNAILSVVTNVVNLILLPLEGVNFIVDVGSSISIVQGFISVVAYLFPWKEITPLIYIVIGFFIFRIAVALIKTLWDLLPIL